MRRVILLNPYSAGSHALWEKGMLESLPKAALIDGQSLELTSYSLPGRHWKWRMHSASLTLVENMAADGAFDSPIDAFIVTDMMDVGQFRSALPKGFRDVPLVQYFHENQLTFPSHQGRPPKDWDRHYAFMNVASAMLADAIWFNSEYHRRSFLEAVPAFLKSLPSPKPSGTAERLYEKSEVVPIGIGDDVFDAPRGFVSAFEPGPPVVVWNHRWEYDKGPDGFFEVLNAVKSDGQDFRLAVLGQSFENSPMVFDAMSDSLGDSIVHWGHVPDRATYLHLLRSCDVALVTAHHDFFGISVLESAAVGLDIVAPNELAYPEHFGAHRLWNRKDLRAAMAACLRKPRRGQWSANAENYRWSKVSEVAWVAMKKITVGS